MTPNDIILNDIILPLVGLALTAVVGWGVKVWNDHSKTKIKAEDQKTLHSALVTGITAVLAAYLNRSDRHMATTQSGLMKEAVDAAMNHARGEGAGDAVDRLKVSKAALERLAKAKFYQLTDGKKSDKD